MELKFSRHGPIFFEDKTRHLAYAVRRAAAEPGTAPYLGGTAPRAGAELPRVPRRGDVLEDADREPDLRRRRRQHLVAARGAARRRAKAGTAVCRCRARGAYEWQGFRKDLPSELNPARGFIATANHNINPPGYTPPLMFKNADTRFERITRLRQIFDGPPQKLTLDDHKRMQHDALSLRALADLALLPRLDVGGSRRSSAFAPRSPRGTASTRRDSRAAALYEAGAARRSGGGRGRGAAAPPPTRDDAEKRIAQAMVQANRRPRSHAGASSTRARSAIPCCARSISARSSAAAAPAPSPPTARSYREILDVANWDRSLVINVPGQSGQPGSPYYDNLLKMWADNEYFPLAFSAAARSTARRSTA